MKSITVPITVPSDILVSLNQSEQELKSSFQAAIAMLLFKDGRLTLGKAIQFSGLARFEFEKLLGKNNISISLLDLEQIYSDLKKLDD
jgi:predicted HTH domain antitoxin